MLLALPAEAASLRGGTTLSDPAVRLSDLFDGVAAGPRDRARPRAGRAHHRGGARNWRPSRGSSTWIGGRRAPRTGSCWSARAGRSRGRRRSRHCGTRLRVAGVSADAEVEMPGYVAPLVPAGAAARAEVGQLDYSPAEGRFTAVLSVTAAGMAPAHARLSGRVMEMVELPVATRRLMPGDVIGPGGHPDGAAAGEPGPGGCGAGRRRRRSGWRCAIRWGRVRRCR